MGNQNVSDQSLRGHQVQNMVGAPGASQMPPADEVVVGTARSLINSIKRRRLSGSQHSSDEEASQQASQRAGNEKVQPEKKIAENENVQPENDENCTDGVDLMVSTPDNYSDNSLDGNKSDDLSPSESESERSDFDSSYSERFSQERRHVGSRQKERTPPSVTSSSESETDSETSGSEPEQFNNNSRGAAPRSGSKRRRVKGDTSDERRNSESDSDTEDEELRELKKDPQIKRLYRLMKRDEKRKRRKKEKRERCRDRGSATKKMKRGGQSNTYKVINKTKKGKSRNKTPIKGNNPTPAKNTSDFVKSPSDTTLYRPAFRKGPVEKNVQCRKSN